MKTILQGFAVALSAVLLGACGGGTSTTGTAGPATASTTGTMVKTSVSTINVNGKAFNVSNASVRINKAAASAADLKSGMRVRVKSHSGGGDRNDATEVESEAEVRGTITAVDAAAKAFSIGMQKVVTDANTVFDDLTPASFDAITEGVVVEVDGTRNAAGDILATRVEGKNANAGGGANGGHDDQLHGTIAATAADGFTIGTTKVIVTATTVFEPAATCALATLTVGQAVEARGAFAADGSFAATRVECDGMDEPLGGDDNGNENEVEGLVSNPNAAAQTFNIDAQVVHYTAATRFKDGTAADLVADARVEVTGTKSGTTLEATEIEIKGRP